MFACRSQWRALQANQRSKISIVYGSLSGLTRFSYLVHQNLQENAIFVQIKYQILQNKYRMQTYNLNTTQPEDFNPSALVNKVKEQANQIKFSEVEGKDVVMTIGPTGAGKSTIINKAAGSEVIFELDKKRCIWKAIATPEIFPVGHLESCTFKPQIWKNQKNGIVYVDCPGLNDTRGVLHEILKSFFLRKLAKTAKTLKVLLICDLPCIQAERMGVFGDLLKQIKRLFPKLQLQTETKLIVTKCTDEFSPQAIQYNMEEIGKQKYKEENITIVFKPTQANRTLQIDVDSIVKDIPSISHQCQLLITADSKQKLREFLRSLSTQFVPDIQTIIKKVRKFYFQFLQATLDEETSVIESAFAKIKQFQQRKVQVRNRKEFVTFLEDGIEKLNYLGQGKAVIKASDTVKGFTKKIENYDYIVDLLGNIDTDALYAWKEMFEINIVRMKKSTKRVALKGPDEYIEYLAQSGINGRQNLKQSIHKIMAQPHQFSASYQGNENKTITYPVQKSVSYNKTWSDIRTINTQEYVNCKGKAWYQGSKQLTHYEQIRYCTHTGCLICNHSYKQYSATVNVSCFGEKQVSKTVTHNVNQTFKVELSKSGKVTHKQSITETRNIKYSDSHKVSCQNHHDCKCKDLVSFITPIDDIIRDIQYLQQVHNRQFQLLQSESPVQSTKESILARLEQKLRNFRIEIRNIVGSQNLGAVSSIIHEQLTADNSFVARYQGTKSENFPYNFSRKQKYGGEERVNGKVKHQASIPFAGQLNFYENKSYTAYIYKDSCSGCWFCTGIKENEKNTFQGTTDIHVQKPYYLDYNFQKEYEYNEPVKYQGEETIQFSGSNTFTINYNGQHTVCCKKGGLGHGHHDCRSCSLWECILTALRDLVEDRARLVTAIRENEEKVKGLGFEEFQ